MSAQLHRRLSQSFVEEILEAFNDHRISEEKACELLGLHRARLYELRERWLQCLIGKSLSRCTVGGRADFIACQARRNAGCMRNWRSYNGERWCIGADLTLPFSPRRRKKPLVIRFSELRFEPLLFGTDTTIPVQRKSRRFLSGSKHRALGSSSSTIAPSIDGFRRLTGPSI